MRTVAKQADMQAYINKAKKPVTKHGKRVQRLEVYAPAHALI